MSCSVTKTVEFDMGHRIPCHKSKCRNFHGHRYKVEATLSGEIQPIRLQSDDGMVLDFGDIKKAMMEHIHDVCDHAFMVYKGDDSGIQALSLLGQEHRTVLVPFVPTAEELAKHFFNKLDSVFRKIYGKKLRLTRVRVYETPTSYVDFDPTWSPIPRA